MFISILQREKQRLREADVLALRSFCCHHCTLSLKHPASSSCSCPFPHPSLVQALCTVWLFFFHLRLHQKPLRVSKIGFRHSTKVCERPRQPPECMMCLYVQRSHFSFANPRPISPFAANLLPRLTWGVGTLIKKFHEMQRRSSLSNVLVEKV